jgi:tetratricopeptide (TPR) repeat protein
MKHEHLQMLKQARTYYENKEFDKALEHFQSLAFLLEGERHTPKEIKAEIQGFIKKLQNPQAFEQEQLAQEKARQHEALLAANVKRLEKIKEEANQYYQANQFEEAAKCYKQILDIEYAVKGNPLEEADALWNIGESYESLAETFKDKSFDTYQNYLRQAEAFIEKALQQYPKKKITDIRICKETLKKIRNALEPVKMAEAHSAVKSEVQPMEEPKTYSAEIEAQPMEEVPAYSVKQAEPSSEESPSSSITDSAEEALNRAYVAIFAVNAQRKPESKQYFIAFEEMNTALKLLNNKSKLSGDDQEIMHNCSRTKTALIRNMPQLEQASNNKSGLDLLSEVAVSKLFSNKRKTFTK